MLTRRAVVVGAVTSTAMLGAGQALAAPGVFTKDGFAIGGYDTAAYWTDKKASVGKVTYSTEWNGVNWIFNSQANADTFKASPDKYAPAFNGYCPFCLAGGRLVPGVGNLFTIYHGKLYLLLSERIKTDFDMKTDVYIERATAYWAKLT